MIPSDHAAGQHRDPHVLVVSTTLDLATDAVIRALGEAGVRCTRWNTEQYPFAEHLTTAFSQHGSQCRVEITRAGESKSSLGDVTSVWYRRVRRPERPDDMNLGVYEFCIRESHAALIGTLLGALPDRVRWMSPPLAVWAAEHKLLQLVIARRAGLIIPETVVTNDPAEVREAYRRFGGAMIAKPTRSGYLEVDDQPYAIYTSQVLEEHVAALEGAELSPVIYQPLMRKRCDVRVTVVGSRLFTAEIDSQSDEAARVDWRRTGNPALPHRKSELPSEVGEASRRLLRELGIAFGALDFVLLPTGEYVFLEVNPNGQWLWLDEQLDLGITRAVADWLRCV